MHYFSFSHELIAKQFGPVVQLPILRSKIRVGCFPRMVFDFTRLLEPAEAVNEEIKGHTDILKED